MDALATLLQSLEACPTDEVSRYIWPRQHAVALTEDFHDFLYRQASDAKHAGTSQRSDLLFDWYEEFKPYVATWELVRQPDQEARIQYAEDNMSWLLTEQGSALLHEWECQQDEPDYGPRRLLIWGALQTWFQAKPDTQPAVFQRLRPFLLDILVEPLFDELRDRPELIAGFEQFRAALPELRKVYNNELFQLGAASQLRLVRQCELMRLRLRLTSSITQQALYWYNLGVWMEELQGTNLIFSLRDVTYVYTLAIQGFPAGSENQSSSLLNRGIAYANWLTENATEHRHNLMLAITDYTTVERFYLVKKHVVKRAKVLLNRSTAYLFCPASNEVERREYLSLAITDCSTAHDLYQDQGLLIDQANALINRGISHARWPASIEVEYCEHLTLAIADYTAAYDLFLAQKQIVGQANALYNRALSHISWPAGDETECRTHLMVATVDCSVAHDLYSSQGLFDNQVSVLTSWSNAYVKWPTTNVTESREHLTLAIAKCTAAYNIGLDNECFNNQAFALYNRGFIYATWLAPTELEQRKYLTLAIADFNTAYGLYLSQKQLANQANLLYNRGTAYLKWPASNEVECREHLSLAINDCSAAYDLYRSQGLLIDQANALSNRGSAHAKWPTSNKDEYREHLTLTIADYTAAYDLLLIHEQIVGQANAIFNRGISHVNWPTSTEAERRSRLTLAIADFTVAHDLYSSQGMSINQAAILLDRGGAHAKWPASNEDEQRERLTLAITDFGVAYDIYQDYDQCQGRATALFSLGLTHVNLPRNKSGGNIYEVQQNQAIKAYLEPAKELFTQLRQPDNVAKTLHVLGACHENIWTGTHYQDAVGCYTQALAIRTPQYLPTECCETARSLGELYLRGGDYKNALVALKRAEQAVDQLWYDANDKGTKRELAARYADLYALLVATYLHEGKSAEAFRYAAAAKGRLLADALNGQHPDRQQLRVRDPQFAQRLQPLLEKEQAAAEARSQLLRDPQLSLPEAEDEDEARAIDLPEHVTLRQQLATLYREQDRLSEDLARDFPELFATQAAPVLEASEALARARQTQATLVEYYRHAQGWVAFIVRPDATEIQVVPLRPPPVPNAPKSVAPSVDELLTEEMGQWAANINRFDRWPRIEHRTRAAALRCFAQVFVHPLLHLLPPGGRLVLAPNQALHGLPLQAVPMPDPADGYLADHFELSFMPSLTALAVRLRQQEVSGRASPTAPFAHPRLLALSCPLPKADPRHLAQVVPEAQAILRIFQAAQHPTTWLQEEARTATVAHVIDACRTAPPTVFYVGCHGGFSAANPAHSGLRLQEGQWLDASCILNELPLRGVALTVLAACQSGRVQVEAGDELVGLPQALLTVGTDMVLASQWAVTDEATRHLMEAFFAALFQPASGASAPTPAQALQRAMRAVRTARDERGQFKWAHPYYWAAFRLLSIPHPQASQAE